MSEAIPERQDQDGGFGALQPPATKGAYEENPLSALLIYSYELSRNNFLRLIYRCGVVPVRDIGNNWEQIAVDWFLRRSTAKLFNFGLTRWLLWAYVGCECIRGLHVESAKYFSQSVAQRRLPRPPE